MGKKKKEGTPRQSEGIGNSKRQAPLLIVAVTLLVLAAVLNLRHLWPAPRLEPVPRPEQALTSHQFPSAAARTLRTPSPLFTALKPETTGIDFVHPIDKDHPLSFLYFSGMASGGLAVGDIDGDQRPDVYIVGGPGKNRLYRQVDDFRFEDITQRAGVDGGDAWGCGATMADVNNDGRLDIYVCNYADPRNESVLLSPNLLYINRGDGKFSEESRAYGLNLSDASLEAVFADYDVDGDLDMYLLTYRYENPRGRPKDPPIVMKDGKRAIHPDFTIYYKLTDDEFLYDPAGRADGLMRNNGDGTFTNVSDDVGIFGAEQGLSATWWDYDDDGLPDLFVGNDFMGSDRLYHNNGDGKFSDVIRSAVPHTSWFSMGSDAADLNGDGRLDLLTADMASTTHFKQKTTMGSMSKNRRFLETAVPRQYMRNALLLNTGTDRFMEVAYLAGLANTDWTWAVKLVDLDNDGRVDVFVTNGSARVFTDSDITLDLDMLVGHTAWDFFRDSPPLKEKNLAFRNLGDLKFENTSDAWGLGHLGVSMAAAHADLDRDGDLDLIVANLEEPITVYRNESSNAHGITVRLEGAASNRFGVGAKVTVRTANGQQVRHLQPSSGFLASNEPIVHFGLGADTAIEELSIRWPSGHVQSFHDLEVDRQYTIAEPTSAPLPARNKKATPSMYREVAAPPGLIHQERPFDDYAEQPLLPYRLSQLGPGLALADWDGDGDDDMFLGGAAGQPGQLAVNQGDGRFQVTSMPSLERDREAEDLGAVWFDLEGDGDLDLYVVSGSNESSPQATELHDRLYLNDGRGSLLRAPQSLPELKDSGSVVCAADFDRDNDVDLFVGGRVIPGKYPLTPNSHLLVNEDGKLVDRAVDVAPGLQTTGLVTSAVWSDADNDGWIDLLVTCEWGSVKFFRNLEGRLVEQTEAAGLAPHTGWWNGIAASDFDHDGDMDYVVTNWGLNTKYHATDEHPSLLYYGDFDNSGTYQLVEAEFEDETLFPMRGKSCSTHAMPFLAERFSTYRDFAAANLQEIYTPQCLEKAYRFAVNTLSSGVLMNSGTGQFEFHALPRFAQASPGFGVVATEVDGDGHPDVYLVQNFFATQPETGNLDGGLSVLLRGTGTGTFDVVEPAESGLIVPDDASAVAAADLNRDHRPDMVVATNNGAPRVFAQQAGTSARLLAVRLKGLPGNPLAAGARVTVRPADGPPQTSEVQSGGGYLSQSPPVLFFGRGSGDGPTEVVVRWPDGRITTMSVSDQSGVVIQQSPAKHAGSASPGLSQ